MSRIQYHLFNKHFTLWCFSCFYILSSLILIFNTVTIILPNYSWKTEDPGMTGMQQISPFFVNNMVYITENWTVTSFYSILTFFRSYFVLLWIPLQFSYFSFNHNWLHNDKFTTLFLPVLFSLTSFPIFWSLHSDPYPFLSKKICAQISCANWKAFSVIKVIN